MKKSRKSVDKDFEGWYTNSNRREDGGVTNATKSSWPL